MRKVEFLNIHPLSLFAPAVPAELGKQKSWQTTAPKPKRPDLKDVWNENDVRGVLLATFGPFCVYCLKWLSWATHEATIDHHRPKKKVAENPNHPGYWWLAYQIRNLLPTCAYCNQFAKKNYFRVGNEHRYFEQISPGTQDQLLQNQAAVDWTELDTHEDPHLFNPYQDNLLDHLCLDGLFDLTIEETAPANLKTKFAYLEELLKQAMPDDYAQRTHVIAEAQQLIKEENWDDLQRRAWHPGLPYGYLFQLVWKKKHKKSYQQYKPSSRQQRQHLFDFLHQALLNTSYLDKQHTAVQRFLYALAALLLCADAEQRSLFQEKLGKLHRFITNLNLPLPAPITDPAS